MGKRKRKTAGTLSLTRLADAITKQAGVLYKVIKEVDAPKEVGRELEFPGSFWDERTTADLGGTRYAKVSTCIELQASRTRRRATTRRARWKTARTSSSHLALIRHLPQVSHMHIHYMGISHARAIAHRHRQAHVGASACMCIGISHAHADAHVHRHLT